MNLQTLQKNETRKNYSMALLLGSGLNVCLVQALPLRVSFSKHI